LARFNARAAYNPPKPLPMITTRGLRRSFTQMGGSLVTILNLRRDARA